MSEKFDVEQRALELFRPDDFHPATERGMERRRVTDDAIQLAREAAAHARRETAQAKP